MTGAKWWIGNADTDPLDQRQGYRPCSLCGRARRVNQLCSNPTRGAYPGKPWTHEERATMSKARLCYRHATEDEQPAVLVDPDDCDTCRIERLRQWADKHNTEPKAEP